MYLSSKGAVILVPPVLVYTLSGDVLAAYLTYQSMYQEDTGCNYSLLRQNYHYVHTQKELVLSK